MERLHLLDEIERGRADIRGGHTVPHEDVVARGGRLESATGEAFPLEAYFGGIAHMGPPAA